MPVREDAGRVLERLAPLHSGMHSPSCQCVRGGWVRTCYAISVLNGVVQPVLLVEIRVVQAVSRVTRAVAKPETSSREAPNAALGTVLAAKEWRRLWSIP